jgi:predicted nucleic acid-binding protein
MVVVSNTSPLSNLAIIGRLGLLRDQFGSVLVPTAVRQELSQLRHSAAANLLDAAFADGWLSVTSLRQAVPGEVSGGLHLGESEALGLALEQMADWVLLDDGDARCRAAQLKLLFIGVLGVLLRAKQEGQIASLAAEIRRLREEARFFVAKALEMELLKAVGE